MRIQTMLNMCQKFKSFVYTHMELKIRNNKKALIITVDPVVALKMHILAK